MVCDSPSPSSLKQWEVPFAKIQVGVFELKKQNKLRKCATLKTDLLLWTLQFSSRHLVLTILWWAGVTEPPREPGSCASDAAEIATDLAYQSWYNEVALKLPHPAPGDTVEGPIQTKGKTHEVVCEVKMPPFPLCPRHQKERSVFALLRLTVADERGVAPLLFLCFPRGEHECWLLRSGERISHLWLFGDSATCELRFGGYELCISTFIVQQAPFCL